MDDDDYQSIYDIGHWKWDNSENALTFKSDKITIEEVATSSAKLLNKIEFRDDIDLLEQQVFKRKYQRPTQLDDVVCLQDVKDIVFYTAPVSILSPAVINMLHLPTTERFLRALILYCLYYLQVLDIMNNRSVELKTKIRSSNSDNVEKMYRENLEDLRLLVAKEYLSIISGTGQYSKYHHMDASKSNSLSREDSLFIGTIWRIAIHIVWITLGRRFHTEIEMEFYRMFNSDIYNEAKHKLKLDLESKLNTREKIVRHGVCMKNTKKLNTHSPLSDEVLYNKAGCFELFGLGDIKYDRLCTRAQFLQDILVEPEHKFRDLGIYLGILGLPRNRFDIMLCELPISSVSSSMSNVPSSSTGRIKTSRSVICRKSQVKQTSGWEAITRPINLPEKDRFHELPEHFPYGTLQLPLCNQTQRRKWLHRTKLKRAHNIKKKIIEENKNML